MEKPNRTNRDFLKWFSYEERSDCPNCGERACVTVEGAVAKFCLGCGAVWVEGERLDRGGAISARGSLRRARAWLERRRSPSRVRHSPPAHR
jgi:ribosomal protein S27E